MDNENFANGLELLGDSAGAELIKTKIWTSYLHPASLELSLMDLFARFKFGNFCHTLHKLRGSILYDGYLKPFAILTDNNLLTDGIIPKLLVHGYDWDLNNGTYDIEAVEYTEETEIPSEESSAGESAGSSPPAFWVDILPAGGSWNYNETDMKAFTVTTNMTHWYLSPTSYYDEFDLVVWNTAQDEEAIEGLYLSGYEIRITPQGNNSSVRNYNAYIYVTNQSNEIMKSLTVTQGFNGSTNPPTVNGVVGDGSFTLYLFNNNPSTQTNDTYIWVTWQPSGATTTDFTVYIEITRGATVVANAMYPHNDNGVQRTMKIPINEAAVEGATYTVTFTSGAL